ncbi:MAG: SDR family NAD(P)-dependent oxidoreductase [Gammaproteobacteria bacterium]|nr:SDR family NAD(P)-dependent oxidoreductase [Gammaproteobacteria bacterium]
MATHEHGAQDNAHPDLGVLAGGVAVVTGGASGIGLALVEKAIAGGMHAVIADIEAPAIDEAESRLADAARAAGVEVFGHRVDVSTEADVLDLEAAVSARFPDSPVSLLCCNAGVGGGGPVSRASDIDWDFVLGVNVKGVANCVRAFVPKMVAGDAPGAVMATSSQDGLCAAQGVYGVSKHACVALMEALYQELNGRLSVHVLCPNVVATNITTSERNRPERFGGPRVPRGHSNPIADRFKAFGMPPSRCADLVFEAIRTGTFYIMAESEDDPGYVRLEAETRMKAILEDGLPYRPRSALIGKVFNPRVPVPQKP